MKLIDADKLRAEIERRRLQNRYIDTDGYEQELFEIIGSLQQEQQEEPDKSLEEAAQQYAEGPECTWVGTTALEEAFKAGAKWQKEQMMRSPLVSVGYTASEELQRINYENGRKDMREQMLKDAVEGEIHLVGFNNTIFIKEPRAEILDRYNAGDKVRIVILKAEEE